MYNHYVPHDTIYQRIPDSEDRHEASHHKEPTKKNFFESFFKEQGQGEKNAGLSGILKRFKLDQFDTGDILLIAVLLLVLLEDDNWEMALILGLVLFLSLGDDDSV